MNPTIVEAPDRPFLLPPTAPPARLPAGWVSEPAGHWAGAAMDVAYDPRRHTVMIALNRLSDRVVAGLRDTGWERQTGDGANELWVRDRLAAARTALDRTGQTPAVEVGGRGL